ncbi:thioesterase family protein [Ectothiorhodospiraceae bacterium WFHF3C12]|nr:thioesterase family protein [Ectothiorhodospiraceae bacterium WFHF3C12]
MPRVQLDLPESFTYRTEIILRVTDMNYAGHMGNDTVMALFHEARSRLLKEGGCEGQKIGGLGLVVADAVVVYKAQAHYAEVMLVEMTARDFNKYGCDLVYRISNRDTGTEIARGKTGIVFFNYEQGRPNPVPAQFHELIGVPA